VNRTLMSFTGAFALALSASVLAQRGTPPPIVPGRTILPAPMTVVTGSLTGTVRDQSRAVVPKIEVILALETDANVAPHRTATDQEGRFRFTGLPLGVYCLTVREPRHGVTSRSGIRVRGAQETNVPVVLGERPPTPTPSLSPACERRDGGR
jgi:hypothetical protein